MSPSLQSGTSGFIVVDNYPLIQEVTLNPPRQVLPLACATLRGFIQDFYGEYRMPSVFLPPWRRDNEEPRITIPCDYLGTYHLAFVLYDGPGAESFVVYLNEQEVGTITAVRDNNRQYLYVSEKAFTFGQGFSVTLVTQQQQGLCRLEDPLLLQQLPIVSADQPRIMNITLTPARFIATEAGFAHPAKCTDTVVAWRTSNLTYCTVQLGKTEHELRPVRTSSWANNHRVLLQGLDAEEHYYLRINGKTRHGQSLNSQLVQFVPGFCRNSSTFDQHLPLQVPIEITAPSASSTMWPMTFGVPLARNTLNSLTKLNLQDPCGQVLPAQFELAGAWPDGSAKWVHVMTRIAPAPHGQYQLTTTRPTPRPPDNDLILKVLKAPDAVHVETGAMRLTMPHKGHKLFDDIIIGNHLPCDGVCLEAVGADGNGHVGMIETVIVETAGPLQATIRVTGWFEGNDYGAFQCRIHAFAGLPWIRVALTFENNVTNTDFIEIKAINLHVRGDFGHVHLGLEEGSTEEDLDPELHLLQWLDDEYIVYRREPGITQAVGSRAPGWIKISGATGGIGIALEDFWQRYPKQMSATKNCLTIGLCPALPADTYARYANTSKAHRLFYYHQNGCYRLRQGVSFSQELIINFATERNTEELCKLLNAPPVAVIPPQQYQQSRVFGELGVTKQLEEYDQVVESCYAAYVADQNHLQSYGFLNYGDWWGERLVNWGNCEYDTAKAFLYEFARSGDARFLELGRAAAVHHRDVDTIRHHKDPTRVGQVCLHCMGHTGGYYRKLLPEWGPGSIETGFALDHTWVEGHLANYFLTGDRRSLETADLVGKRHAGLGTNNFDFDNCRSAGWLLILSTIMYEATNDPFYLNASHIIVERVLERQTPDGGWCRQLMPGHCHDLPRHRGNAGFMVGILLSGLRRYYEITGDTKVGNAIISGARFLVSDMWVSEARGFRYTSCPNSPVQIGLNFLILDGLSLAWRLTKDTKLRQVVSSAAQAHLEETVNLCKDLAQLNKHKQGVGKSVSMTMCFTPRIIAELVRLREEQEM